MADDKKGREKQARDQERRQRERELSEARERADEPEPVDDDSDEWLGDFDDVLEDHEYPTTADELTATYGDREVETREGWKSVDEVLGSVSDETYDSAADVRNRVEELTGPE